MAALLEATIVENMIIDLYGARYRQLPSSDIQSDSSIGDLSNTVGPGIDLKP